MTRTLINPPAAEPVSLAEMKAHLRLETDDEDGLVAGLIASARGMVEAATRRVLVTQTWRLFLDGLPRIGLIEIPVVPARRVVSLTVFDADGMAVEVPAEDYVVDIASAPARLKLRSRPVPGRALNGVEIDVEAGYGAAGADVPAPLRQAVMMLAAHGFANREAASDLRLAMVPAGVERMLAPFRVLSL